MELSTARVSGKCLGAIVGQYLDVAARPLRVKFDRCHGTRLAVTQGRSQRGSKRPLPLLGICWNYLKFLLTIQILIRHFNFYLVPSGIILPCRCACRARSEAWSTNDVRTIFYIFIIYYVIYTTCVRDSYVVPHIRYDSPWRSSHGVFRHREQIIRFPISRHTNPNLYEVAAYSNTYLYIL